MLYVCHDCRFRFCGFKEMVLYALFLTIVARVLIQCGFLDLLQAAALWSARSVLLPGKHRTCTSDRKRWSDRLIIQGSALVAQAFFCFSTSRAIYISHCYLFMAWYMYTGIGCNCDICNRLSQDDYCNGRFFFCEAFCLIAWNDDVDVWDKFKAHLYIEYLCVHTHLLQILQCYL